MCAGNIKRLLNDVVIREKQMNRDELIQLVDRIMKCEGTEEEVDNMIALLRKNVVDPYVTNYIYYEENTPEELVDKALAYKPIIL